MKVLKMLLLTVMAIGLAACSKDATVNPTSVKINGPLSQYFEVVDRPYKISDGSLSVEFKRIAVGGPTEADWSSTPTFTVELLDKDGNSISSESTDVVFSKEQLEAVFSLGVDESSSITFKFDDYKGAVKFKVSSKWGEESAEVVEEVVGSDDSEISEVTASDVESESVETVGSSGNEDWDALLDSYDKYVTKYISFMKKAANGDMSAMTEYPALLEQAQEYGNKLQNAKGEMSAAQWSRYIKITQKMSSAAGSM